jgi:hypothetical protein
MNTNDFIQKVEREFESRYDFSPWFTEAVPAGIKNFYREKFLEHEKLIREEERERILTAFNSNERVQEGGCDGCDKNLEMIEQIRDIISPDSEKGKNNDV